MNDEELRNLRKKTANELKIMATPIDFERMIKEGFLKKIGSSYYANDIKALPDNVAKKIRSISPSKHGAKLTFYKEAQEIKSLAEKTKHLRGK